MSNENEMTDEELEALTGMTREENLEYVRNMQAQMASGDVTCPNCGQKPKRTTSHDGVSASYDCRCGWTAASYNYSKPN